MEPNLNIRMLARDARSHYDAYQILQQTSEQRREKQTIKTRTAQRVSADPDQAIPVTSSLIDLTSPALLCLAFSLELHLKLLLYVYAIPSWGHDISKLMRQLPAEVLDSLSQDPAFHPTERGEHFWANVQTASHLFIRIRYYFEQMGTLHFNNGFCATFCAVLRKRIAEQVPRLQDDLGFFAE